MKYILHSYRRCPFCIRVRILLYLKQIPYETIEEPLRVWTPWMREWSAKTGERPRVPILRVIDEVGTETVITESNNILQVLDAEHVPISYTPAANSKASQEMLAWFTWCDEVLKQHVDLFKYGKNLVFDTTEHIQHTDTLRNTLTTLEAALTDTNYLLENRLTLADIAIIPFIRQIMRTREGECSFTDFPGIKAWANTIIEAVWFRDIVMKK
jgi:glutathione S-transferase